MKRFVAILIIIFTNFRAYALTAKQNDDLIFMYQEIKLAQNVYAYLGNLYNLSVFKNISNSEVIQMSEINKLFDTYNITMPPLRKGEFIDNNLQNLYVELIKSGRPSIQDSIKVGIIMEETDISDLKARLKNTPNDIRQVYLNLLNCSKQNLKTLKTLQ